MTGRTARGRARATALASLAALATWATLAGMPAHAEDAANLEQVLAPFAEVRALSAHFREEKRIALLKQPLESEGELHYARPYQLVRRTTAPVPSRLIVKKGRLTMVDESGPQHLDLESQPEVAALVEALMLLFEGDAAKLKALMKHELRVDEDGTFHLTLSPRDEKLGKLIREMQAEGRGARLSSLRIVDGFGDVTLTRFSDVQLREPFDEEERARLFRVAP